MPDFAAKLAGKPLKARAGSTSPPLPLRREGLTIEGWEIAEVLGFVPGVPRPVAGFRAGRRPRRGRAGRSSRSRSPRRAEPGSSEAKAGPAPLGNVVFQWTTDADAIAITGLEIFAFGGKVTGEARIPTRPGRPLEASANLKGIDTGRLAADLPRARA